VHCEAVSLDAEESDTWMMLFGMPDCSLSGKYQLSNVNMDGVVCGKRLYNAEVSERGATTSTRTKTTGSSNFVLTIASSRFQIGLDLLTTLLVHCPPAHRFCRIMAVQFFVRYLE
jgi:hypothetical protein